MILALFVLTTPLAVWLALRMTRDETASLDVASGEVILAAAIVIVSAAFWGAAAWFF